MLTDTDFVKQNLPGYSRRYSREDGNPVAVGFTGVVLPQPQSHKPRLFLQFIFLKMDVKANLNHTAMRMPNLTKKAIFVIL